MFYSDKIVDHEDLIIPHPRLHLRNFVLYPLNDIASDLIHPILLKPINELLEECEDDDSPIRVIIKLIIITTIFLSYKKKSQRTIPAATDTFKECLVPT